MRCCRSDASRDAESGEHIDLFSSYYPNPLPHEETLTIAGLNDIKDRRYGELSGGQKQRVLFAISVCGDPDLLFLTSPRLVSTWRHAA